MITLRTPRFWLMTTAAVVLGLGAQTAHAQSSYQSGAPVMVAAAPSFPNISAEQIARDVTESYNPRSGQKELAAAPFDAFEEDPSLAGSVRLRSADGAVSLDGQGLTDGAILEVDFYYNSPSDDPFGGRGYGDAGFVNGDLAPVVLRDSRVLECSTRVENVVYDHTSYYDRGLSLGVYRPYRHYSGHSGFGFGFGSSYFGPGYGYYSRNHGVRRGYSGRSRSIRRSRGNRGSSRRGIHSRVLDAARGGNRSDTRGTRGGNDRVRGGSTGRNVTPRTSRRGLSERQIEDRMSRIESYDGRSTRGNTRSGSSRNGRGSTNGPMRAVNPRQRLELAPSAAESSSRTATPERRETRSQPRRAETPRVEPQRAETRRAEPRRSETRRSEPRRSTPRRESGPKTQPKRSSSPKRATRSTPRRQIRSIRRQLDFFPGNAYGGRSAVTSSRSVDCAREDKLQVFLPNDRLDAARFDGLTVIALDSQGGETPIYIPPNYIEGFRLAASGQVRPQGYQSAPQPRVTPQYNPQPNYQSNPSIEAAPCPSGTQKQADGTCLQTSSQGYPTR